MKSRIEVIVRATGADFTYGKPRQILADIISRESSMSNKIDYPLIILEYPFTYTPSGEMWSVRGVKLYLCQHTSESKHNDERYSDSYEPILIPLFKRLDAEMRKQSVSYECLGGKDNPFASVQISNDSTGYMPEYFDIIETTWNLQIHNIKNC